MPSAFCIWGTIWGTLSAFDSAFACSTACRAAHYPLCFNSPLRDPFPSATINFQIGRAALGRRRRANEIMVPYRSLTTLIAVGAVASGMSWKEPAIAVIGILEQPPQCSSELGELNEGVRPIFARQHNAWVALLAPDSLHAIDLRAMKFTLAFDGRSLGTLDTRDPGFRGDDGSFPRHHLLRVLPGETLPHVANRQHRFQG